MCFSQHTTEFGKASFQSLCLCCLFLLCQIEISLVVCLCRSLKSLGNFTSKFGYGCNRKCHRYWDLNIFHYFTGAKLVIITISLVCRQEKNKHCQPILTLNIRFPTKTPAAKAHSRDYSLTLQSLEAAEPAGERRLRRRNLKHLNLIPL